jgi:hypothetical protein
MRGLYLPEPAKLLRLQHGFFDDFQGYLSATATDKYTEVTTTDGTVLQKDAREGGVAIKTAVATAGNEETYLARESELFCPTADRPITFGALVQATEDDTNQNNLYVGIADAVAAALLRDDGAGPKTSGTMIGFYKVDGGLNWNIVLSIGGTQTKVELSAANTLTGLAYVGSGSAKQFLEFDFLPKNATQSDVIFKIDDVPVYKATDWVFTSATDAQAVAGAKDGDSADEVTLNLYGWYGYQAR